MMVRDHLSEVSYGFLFGAIATYPLGLWAILVGVVSGVLWRLGGAYGFSKAYRRVGVSVLIPFSLMINLWPSFHANIIFNTVMSSALMWGVLSIGYGIPDDSDRGSTLGNITISIFSDYKMADIATRAVIGLLLVLSLLPLYSFGLFYFALLFCSVPVIFGGLRYVFGYTRWIG